MFFKLSLLNFETVETLNSATHIIGAVLALVASFLCVTRAIELNRFDYLVIGLVYCISMLLEHH